MPNVRARVSASNEELERQLITIASESPWFMEALLAVRKLELSSWCIGAGAVRNLVWDALHETASPSALSDIDVAYYDGTNLTAERDTQLQQTLASYVPIVPWEVTNQAGVHQWFEGHFGHAVEPLRSLEEAVASWPEYATSVGISIQSNGLLRVIAPHGLQDLFAIVVRRNPTRVSVETYRQRVAQKRYAERWPKVKVVLC